MHLPLTGMVSRHITETLHTRLADEPVIVLNGPRAVGKSTLLADLAQSCDQEVLDLDEPETRQAVHQDPSLYASGEGPVLIDEFQHAPELLDAIKARLNRDLRPGQYVLTGSTRYTTLPRAAQALTGRVHIMAVWPLSQGEIGHHRETFLPTLLENPGELVSRTRSTTTREEYIQRVTAGGYPLALRRPSGPSRSRWFHDYIELVIERDVLDIAQVRQRAVLPRLLRQLASQTGQLLNIAEASRKVGLEETTAENYTKLLEAVFLIHRLPSWGTTLGARVAKAPKLHVVDSGLAAWLLGLTPTKLASKNPALLTEFGHLVETFTVNEVLKQVSRHAEPITCGHFRTHDGHEVDLVLERNDGRTAAIEAKAGSRVSGDDLRPLRLLRDRLGERFLGGTVLYTGTRSYTYEDRIHVLPLDRLWQ